METHETPLHQLYTKSWPQEEINPYQRWVTAGVPLWLLQQRGVSDGAKLLYARLILYAGKSGRRAYPNQGTLATDLGITDRQVRRLVKELEVNQLILARKRAYGGADHYTFLYHPWQELGIHSNFRMSVTRQEEISK